VEPSRLGPIDRASVRLRLELEPTQCGPIDRASFCLRLQMEPNQLVPIDGASFCLRHLEPTRLGPIEGASFCVRLQVEPSRLGPIGRTGLYLRLQWMIIYLECVSNITVTNCISMENLFCVSQCVVNESETDLDNYYSTNKLCSGRE
jgi:hypothetical protein